MSPKSKTVHGGNVGSGQTPFYLNEGQCAPEYDQGHSVVVWYDDLYLLAERADKAEAERDQLQTALREEIESDIASLEVIGVGFASKLHMDQQRAADYCRDMLAAKRKHSALLPGRDSIRTEGERG